MLQPAGLYNPPHFVYILNTFVLSCVIPTLTTHANFDTFFSTGFVYRCFKCCSGLSSLRAVRAWASEHRGPSLDTLATCRLGHVVSLWLLLFLDMRVSGSALSTMVPVSRSKRAHPVLRKCWPSRPGSHTNNQTAVVMPHRCWHWGSSPCRGPLLNMCSLGLCTDGRRSG